MVNLQVYSARICQTAAAFLIHGGRVLLVKHKKLGFWLAPGGHVEAGELLHQAAERECQEETGIAVHAVDACSFLEETVYHSRDAQYLPPPFAVNLHWISRENYLARQKNPDSYQPLAPWQNGCEQHLGFCYLVKPLGSLEVQPQAGETTEVAWFLHRDIAQVETTDNIRHEIFRAFACHEFLSRTVQPSKLAHS